MALYEEYYDKVKVNKRNFEKLLDELSACKNIDCKLNLAKAASTYAVYNNTGYFTSSILETFFTDYAETLKTDIKNIKYKENSFLHVLTEGYNTGGHTRVVERWIKNATSNQIHSVVEIKSIGKILTTLQENIKEKNGEYIQFDNNLSMSEKSLKLRELGMHYEYIILHSHMDDPIPTIAFGTEEFTRPVLLYNHASHLFWLGKSVADLVLDIEKDDEVTKIKRGISNTYFLGVPTNDINLSDSVDKNEIRKKINLPTDKKIIVTSGHEIKFRTIGNDNYIDTLKKIIDNDTFLYAIGISKENKDWIKANKETGNHIVPIEFIDFNNGFLDYLKCADLYLDSYPLCGGTAVIDAISSGTPALSLKSVYPQFDYLTSTDAYCKTKEELIKKAKQILNNKEFGEQILNELKISLIQNQSTEAWNKKLESLYSIAPKVHKVRDLTNEQDFCEITDLSVLCNVITNEKFLSHKNKIMTGKDIKSAAKYGILYKKMGIPYICEYLIYKDKDYKKTKIYKLFNIKIFENR